jgi:hypothetical protein
MLSVARRVADWIVLIMLAKVLLRYRRDMLSEITICEFPGAKTQHVVADLTSLSLWSSGTSPRLDVNEWSQITP